MIITARYAGRCKLCGGTIQAGERVNWAKHWGTSHLAGGCDGSGLTRDEWDGQRARDEADYQRGMAEADAYLSDVRIYGQELADQWEMDREMRGLDW